MLSLEQALFRQSSSRAKITDASRDLATIRDPFISPAHLTKPERWSLTGGGGAYTKGCLSRHVAFFNIRIVWQDPEILIYKSIS